VLYFRSVTSEDDVHASFWTFATLESIIFLPSITGYLKKTCPFARAFGFGLFVAA